MKTIFKLIVAIVLPVILTVALGYAQSIDSQPDTVTLEEVLKSID